MNLGQLSAGEFRERMAGPGIGVRAGAFALRVRSDAEPVHEGFRLLYAGYPVVEPEGFCDYAVDIRCRGGLRRFAKRQVRFLFDGAPVFEPLPLEHALPLAEWALNWCISTHAHQYLVLHAAVVERGGHAAILPAPPGSGKSTLCAALVHRGWRLLSDELALLSLADRSLAALARPISLKNESIDLIASYAPGATFGKRTVDTRKGTVALLKAPDAHVARAAERARPAWIVFPTYVAGAAPLLTSRPKADSMLELSRNAFNFGPTGREGFEALADAVDASGCYDFTYGRLDDAIAQFDALGAGR
ncbi:MAG: HprK-related kinase A [Burkholderiales bacterium]|nr:HprK-related kinase A [Burkholderiales bacterium]